MGMLACCTIFWGTPAQPGSLCNLREIVRRTRVDKNVKVFNVGDEFLLHAFKSHLIASILQVFNIEEITESIDHECSHQWLLDTAKMIVSSVLMPKKSEDPVHYLHTAFLHLSFMYIDLIERQYGGKTGLKLSDIGNCGYQDLLQQAVKTMLVNPCIYCLISRQAFPSILHTL